MRGAFVGAAAAVIALSGCVAVPPLAPADVQSTVVPSPEVVDGEYDPIADLPESELGDHVTIERVRFGETAVLAGDEGTVTISPPEPFIPSAGVVPEKQWDEFVVMTVTVTNDWFDRAPVNWSIRASVGEEGEELEEIVDHLQQVGAPIYFLRPGESATYRVAFGRQRGDEFVVYAGSRIAFNHAYFS